MTWVRAGVVIASVVAGCAFDDLDNQVDGRQLSIVNGSIDNTEPAVVLLRITVGQSLFLCSGTLITPRIVLTAAHCLDGASAVSVHTGTTGETASYGAVEFVEHPDWTGDLNAGNDIALVLIGQDVPGVAPIPYNRTPATTLVGQSIKLVGYGVTANGATDSGTRRSVMASLTQVVNAGLYHFGSSTGTVCFGDSGGPDLITIGGVRQVVGVHSYVVAPSCAGAAGSTRVDAHADTFIAPFIATRDPATPPVVSFADIADGDTLPRSFSLRINASDNVSVQRVELTVAGQVQASDDRAPYDFDLADLPIGPLAIEARAFDNRNDPASSTIQVTIDDGADDPVDPETPDEPDVPGPETPDPGDPDVPSGRSYIGGCSTGGGAGLAGLLAVAIAIAGLRRRRARAPARGGLLALFSLAIAAVATPAFAAPDGAVAILGLDDDDELRGAAAAELERAGAEVSDPELVIETLAELALPMDQGEDFVALARRLELAAIAVGRLDRAGGKWRLGIELHRGADGEVIDRAELRAPSVRLLRKRLRVELRRLSRRAARGRMPEPARARAAIVTDGPGAGAARIEIARQLAAAGYEISEPGGALILIRADIDKADGTHAARLRLIARKSEHVVEQRKLSATTADGLRSKLRRSIARLIDDVAAIAAAPASAVVPAPAPVVVRRASPGPTVPAGEIAVAFSAFTRSLSSADDRLRYSMSPVPAYGVNAEWYPGSHLPSAPLSFLGVAGSLVRSVPFTSAPEIDGEVTDLDSASSEYAVGLRVRHQVGPVELRGAVDLGGRSFHVAIPDGVEPALRLPDASYRYLRGGLSGKLPINPRFAVSARAGYRHVLGSGEMEADDFYPGSTAWGLDASARLSAAIAFGLTGYAALSLERYAHDLAGPMATTATDRYASGELGVAYGF